MTSFMNEPKVFFKRCYIFFSVGQRWCERSSGTSSWLRTAGAARVSSPQRLPRTRWWWSSDGSSAFSFSSSSSSRPTSASRLSSSTTSTSQMWAISEIIVYCLFGKSLFDRNFIFFLEQNSIGEIQFFGSQTLIRGQVPDYFYGLCSKKLDHILIRKNDFKPK